MGSHLGKLPARPEGLEPPTLGLEVSHDLFLIDWDDVADLTTCIAWCSQPRDTAENLTNPTKAGRSSWLKTELTLSKTRPRTDHDPAILFGKPDHELPKTT